MYLISAHIQNSFLVPLLSSLMGTSKFSPMFVENQSPRINLFDFILDRHDVPIIGYGTTVFNAYCMTFLVKQGVCEYFRNDDALTKYDISCILPDINPELHRTQATGNLTMSRVGHNDDYYL